jgi:hydrogenase/urease accessory protein HupE
VHKRLNDVANQRLWALVLVIAISGTALSGIVVADDLQPLFVKISQTEENFFSLSVKSSPSVTGRQTAMLLPPCELRDGSSAEGPGQWQLGTTYFCPESHPNIELIRSAEGVSPTALIRLERRSGDLEIYHLPPGQERLVIDRLGTTGSVFVQYLSFGFQHILEGYDHLLFVLCLLLLAGSLLRVLVMITGFTLAHSLTLGLSVMQWIEVPLSVVEVLIALSIVMLAREVLRMDRRTWSFRYPVLVSSAFGLLHGLGFAAAMKRIGLPQDELVWALLAFNVGVEAGQILFVLMVLLVFVALVRLHWVSADQAVQGQTISGQRWISYGIGGVSSYWLIDRLWQWLSGPFGLA